MNMTILNRLKDKKLNHLKNIGENTLYPIKILTLVL
ncbi:unnamed protein product [Trichobilharzia regenti]|nr:unnamed protein product [Trichobilharzia regenti]